MIGSLLDYTWIFAFRSIKHVLKADNEELRRALVSSSKKADNRIS